MLPDELQLLDDHSIKTTVDRTIKRADMRALSIPV
jgi:hypothetical protein